MSEAKQMSGGCLRKRIRTLTLWGGIVAGGGVLLHAAETGQAASGSVSAIRLSQNPLITLRSSTALGDNINGPTIVRLPAWIERPLGRYYLYFAHHMGQSIRLAYADAITGPWKVYEPGVLPVGSTAMFRPQPDPPENIENFYTHVASPEIYFDNARHKVVMWFHGWWTNGQRWPIGEPAAREWARQNGFGQYTQVAESDDGINFSVRPAISRTSYVRVFTHDGTLYGMSRLGLLLRTSDPLSPFEAGVSAFRDGPYAGRVRHVALVERAGQMYVFFTAIGDAPERIMVSTMSLAGDWRTWKASEPAELLRPAAPYECTNLPNEPSEAGDVKGPVQQLRDPGIFEEAGKTYLFYSFCGEQGIAAAEISWGDGR
jgi:hypothetical protein